MRVFLIDNFDSFTYNLAQAFQKEGCAVEVKRNNAVTLKEIEYAESDAVAISPGPGHPADSRGIGICNDVIRELEDLPMLGVCLGHQAIIHSLGGKVVRAPKPMHGKNSPVHHNGDEFFEGVSNPFSATRYHSLVGTIESLPKELLPLAFSEDDGCLMAVRHSKRLIYGVQFHPEAILTKEGPRMIRNFLGLVRR